MSKRPVIEKKTTIDSEPFYWVTEEVKTFTRSYFKPGETPVERSWEIVSHAQSILESMFRAVNGSTIELPVEISTFAEVMYDYIGRGWVSFSTPVWSNFGRDGLPVSCNGVNVDDDMESILFKVGEVGQQTKFGAGTSVYLGNLRGRGAPIRDGGKADGAVSFFELFQATTDIISQGPRRRGAIAGYIPADHPDILEWLRIRQDDSPIHSAFSGVCISDDWLEAARSGDQEKGKVWAEILRQRDETGQPYIWFSDTANRGAPEVYQKSGRKIYGSNLCNEIALSHTANESFVCVLSSLNAYFFEEWKETNLPQLMLMLLDAVTEEYIQKTYSYLFMGPSRNFAYNQRAVGVGVLGLHSAYQRYLWPFESEEAREFNIRVHSTIDEQTMAASRKMAVWFGEPPLLKGYRQRNTTRMAIAPTKSSSFILGAISEGIQPIFSNVHTKDLAKGKFAYHNPELRKALVELGKDTKAVWDSIEANAGSVQHLDWMPENLKAVFKTFVEIDQKEIVIQAADRQKFIDQGQSLNLCFPVTASPAYISSVLLLGYDLGVKGFYYQLADRNSVQRVVQEECVACHA